MAHIPPVSLPRPALEIIRRFWTCEFTTLAHTGAPITWPVFPSYLAGSGRFLIAAPLGYPQKALNVRRDPHVSLLYSDPTGSGLQRPGSLLIQGLAECPETIFTSATQADPEVLGEVQEQLRRVLREQPAVSLYLSTPLARWLMDWYFMRLLIFVTPRRVIWQPAEEGAGPPRAFAPLPRAARPSDPLWAMLTRYAPRFASAVLTSVGGDGFPASLRCRPLIEPAPQRLRLHLPAGAGATPGPASLLYHRHDERLWGLLSFLLTGELAQEGGDWVFRPARFLPGMGIGGLRGYWRFVMQGRRTAAAYLARRGLPRPQVAWDEMRAGLDLARQMAEEER